MKKISIIIGLSLISISILAQKSTYDININEIYLHPKNPKKDWVEFRFTCSGKQIVLDSLYLTDDIINITKWNIKNKPLKVKEDRFYTVFFSKMLALNPSSNANVNFHQSKSLYLFSQKGVLMDSISLNVANDTIIKNSSIIRVPKSYSPKIKKATVTNKTELTKAITRNKANLTLASSYPKKAFIANIGLGLGTAKLRTSDNPSKTPLKYSWNIGLLREQQTFLKYTKIQYGLDFTKLNYGIKSSKTDTLRQVNNGVERVTIRKNDTKGWKKNYKVSIPIIANTRISNKFSVKTGFSLNISSTFKQHYTSELKYYNGATGELIQTVKFDFDDNSWESVSIGAILGIDYHLSERQTISLNYLGYKVGRKTDSATGKTNSNFGLFASYGFKFMKGKKRIPKYQVID